MEFAEIMRRRTMKFALAIIRFCRTLPRDAEGSVIRYQLLKSGTSVGANYRSSCRGRTTREKRSKLGIALEEADESDYWLAILEFTDRGNKEQRKWLLAECGELIGIFAQTLQTHKDNDRRDDAAD